MPRTIGLLLILAVIAVFALWVSLNIAAWQWVVGPQPLTVPCGVLSAIILPILIGMIVADLMDRKS